MSTRCRFLLLLETGTLDLRVLTELLTYHHQREGHHLLQFLSP